MANQVWLYKWNDKGRFHTSRGRDWSEVFDEGGVQEGFGFHSRIGRTLIQQVRPRDRFVAYQTDKKLAVGLCEVIKVSPNSEDPSLEFRPVRRFKRPVPIHRLKKKNAALQRVQALRQGPVQSLYALDDGEARAVLDACEGFQTNE